MPHAAGIVAAATLAALAARVAWPTYLVAWVELVPWILALDRVTTWRGALVSGVAMAIAFCVAVFSWFPPAIADYASAPVGVVAAMTLVAAPLFQPQFIAFALVRHGARRRRLGDAATVIAAAGAYVGAEWAIPKLFGDTLGMSLLPSRWLRQAADLSGPAALTFIVVLVNQDLAVAIQAARRRDRGGVGRALGGGATAIASLALYGMLRLQTLADLPTDPPITVGIVQANVAHYDRLAAEVGTYEAVHRILDAHFALSDEILARGPIDLLVWPETVYPTTFGAPKSADGAAFDRAIGALVARSHRPLVFGSYDAEDGREYNAAVFLEPAAGDDVAYASYRKASLFPLTERVPAWLDGPTLRHWLPWLGSWQPGAGSPVVDAHLPGDRTLRVAPLICYDAVDPVNVARAVRSGARLVVTLSNDSWLADGAGADLHFVVSVFRSIETRRPQVRATTTGISAIVTPLGDVVASAGVHARTTLVGSVAPVRDVTPLAVRWGNWIGPLGLAIALALLLGGRGAAPTEEA
jgi:apolipoprotein N-acyltransferase